MIQSPEDREDSEVQYIDKITLVPDSSQRQTPTIQSSRQPMEVPQKHCVDRVADATVVPQHQVPTLQTYRRRWRLLSASTLNERSRARTDPAFRPSRRCDSCVATISANHQHSTEDSGGSSDSPFPGSIGRCDTCATTPSPTIQSTKKGDGCSSNASFDQVADVTVV